MSLTPLLPERHPNKDFFIADIFDSLPVKSDKHTMEHPFFTLSTKKDIRSVKYEHAGVKIVLSPSAEYGLPTMMDKDILLYCGSLLMAEINNGRIPPKIMRISAHDLMVTTNRPTDGNAYRLLKNAFERLTGCTISTNIRRNGENETDIFHIIERARVVESSRHKNRMVRVEVTLSDWFFNALVGKEVLTINRDYFRLRKPLERRLYELARKHCGHQAQWRIGLENLQTKCGSQSPLKKFRYQLRQIIETDHLPDYRFEIDKNGNVNFYRREQQEQEMMLPGFDALPSFKPETLCRGAEIVEKAGTGWDYQELRTQFCDQILSGKFKPKSVDGAFIAFVKKKVKERP